MKILFLGNFDKQQKIGDTVEVLSVDNIQPDDVGHCKDVSFISSDGSVKSWAFTEEGFAYRNKKTQKPFAKLIF